MTDTVYSSEESRTALVHRHLERRAIRDPDGRAYSYDPVSVDAARADAGTWSDLNAMAASVARTLEGAGVSSGDFVLTLLGQSPTYIATFVGVAKLGATIVPLDFRTEKREMRDVLERTEPTAFVGVDSYRGDSYRDVLSDIDAFADVPARWWVDTENPARQAPRTSQSDSTDTDVRSAQGRRYELSVVDENGADLPAGEATGHLDPDTPFLVVFTSGTTGRPKGVLLGQRSVAFQGSAIVDTWDLDEADVELAHLPPSHVGGSTELLAPAMMAGVEMVFLDDIDPGVALERIDEHDVTIVGNVPTLWEMFFAYPNYRTQCESVRIAGSAGQAASAETVEQMAELGMPATGWGLTETGGFVTMTDAGASVEVVTETVGRPYPGMELRVRDQNGEALPRGETGELHVRGEGTMLDYLEADHDGEWVATGDLGYVDEDGRVRLQGRAHEMYISGGYNVYPAEVQDVLASHPGVRHAAVIGVADDTWGETGHAFVVPESDAAGDLTATSLEEWCEGRLADYKRPAEYTIESSLPQTMIGKIDRQGLKAEFDLETVE